MVSWVADVHVVADCLGVFLSGPHSGDESQTPCQGDCVEGNVLVQKVREIGSHC